MLFKTVAYTSLAALDMDERQLLDILVAAQDLNGIDGITGLLIYNGTHFLQWIEGPPAAIDDLVERLRRDPRHSGFEIREQGLAQDRLFGDWSMKLVQVRTSFLEARDDLIESLPAGMSDSIRERIARMVEQISIDVSR